MTVSPMDSVSKRLIKILYVPIVLQIATTLQSHSKVFTFLDSTARREQNQHHHDDVMNNNVSFHHEERGFMNASSSSSSSSSASTTPGAPPITTTRRYGDSTLKGPRAGHPHAGAIDEFGHFGYVHDPTILQNTPSWSSLSVSPEEQADLCAPLGFGPEGYGDFGRMAMEQIQVASSKGAIKKPKVFCAIYTYPGNNNLTDGIRMTWGRRCDGFMAASTETNHDAATVNLPHDKGYRGKYKGIWQKVRSMLGYIYDNFLEQYDFFVLCGDDTFFIMENLKAFLTSPKLLEYAGGMDYPNPVYVGAWTHPIWMQNNYNPDFYYRGGGSGYVLSRRTVRALVEDILPVCHNQTIGSAEDVYIGECLQKHLNLTGYDARDEQGRNRFIPYNPLRLAAVPEPGTASNDKRFSNYVRSQNKWLEEHHNWTSKYGVDAISPSAISFHIVQPAIKMKRYERIFYRMENKAYDTIDCQEHYSKTTAEVQ